MDTDLLARGFRRNVTIVAAQAAGLTHEDALTRTEYHVNCFNWVVGHIVASRHDLLAVIDGSDRWDPAPFERYARESDPIHGDGPGVIPLEGLLTALTESQERLEAFLDGLSPAEMEEQIDRDGRVASRVARLLFAYFHDTYHTGQTDVIRQLSGKSDTII